MGRVYLKANADIFNAFRVGVQDWRLWLVLSYVALVIWLAVG